ncbi:MAG: protein kinase domain-containing protein, partial [Myxococcaceae bacterium]
RLKQERDALAALEHPNIARLYDAGLTETGRPYIAMEYVDGVPIDAYAAAHALSLRERLSLFFHVAAAVSYAHARLVVHRDLKPTNILVSGSGSVRLLDFGAAKLLREDGPGDSELTREIGPALSPDYASPEQIRGERVTVAADVYSLGVVLFELLTGQRPYRLPRDSWGALVEAVAKIQPPLASTRVVSDRRAARAIHGDLDAVVAKALRREVAQRYASVQALADDISRYLAGEPVVAKDQSAGERLWKFVSRHALAVGTAAVVTLVVGAASGVALWQARVARAEARRAERVRAFIASILTSATPRTGVGGVVTASELLTAAAGRIDSELSAEPGVAAELGVIVAQSFDSLGELAKAEPVLRAAVPRAEATFGRSHPLTLRAKTVLADAVVLHDVPGALAIIEEVVPAALRGLPATADEAVAGLKEKAYVLAKLNRAEDSYAALRESVALAEKHFGPLDERTIMALGSLANTYGRFGDFPNQIAVAADAVERARRAFGAQRPHETLIMMERFYADALRDERPGDSVPIYRTVLADQQRLDAAETTRVRDAKLQLAYALLLSGRLEEGLPLVREAVALERQQNPAESDDRRGFGMALSLALVLAQRTDEGLQEQERLAALVARLGTEPHRSAVLRRIRSARLYALAGQSARAQTLAAEAESMATPGEESTRVQAELTRAFDARLQLHHSEALERLEQTLREHRIEKMSTKIQAEVAAELGMVRLELGDLAAAEEELARCGELFTRAQVEISIPMTPCLVGAARLQLRAGRPAEAERLLVPLAASWEQVNPDGPGRGEVLHWLARAEEELGKRGLARRDAGLADGLLRRAKVPALLRLAGTRVGATSPRTPADAAP